MLSRRSLLVVPPALILAGARANPPRGRLIAVRGTRLFVDEYGDPSGTPIVYVHGGPGAGSYDAGLYQGARIGMGARLLCVDQRGVLRSDPATKVTVDDVVEDLEAMRQSLGISRWVVWGHSFGGFYATRYARRYGSAVAALVYENCTFNTDDTLKSMLRACADVMERLGDSTGAVMVRAKADAPVSPRERLLSYVEYSQKLGPERSRIYVHQEQLLNFFGDMVKTSNLGERWAQESAHYESMIRDDALYENLCPQMAAIRAPALMILGRYDHVTTPSQVDVFRRGANREVQVFERSSHFVHVEEADGFARTVLQFIRNIG